MRSLLAHFQLDRVFEIPGKVYLKYTNLVGISQISTGISHRNQSYEICDNFTGLAAGSSRWALSSKNVMNLRAMTSILLKFA